jgi:hypothetical protein
VPGIKHFLDLRHGYDYAAIRQLVAEVASLKVPDIKAIGERVPVPPDRAQQSGAGEQPGNRLSNIKLSAEQSSFTLTGAGM